MRVERIDVVLNTKAHDLTLLVDRVYRAPKRLPVASLSVFGRPAANFRNSFKDDESPAGAGLSRCVRLHRLAPVGVSP
jgi:hypothetical protein